jgi:hypothetical protein
MKFSTLQKGRMPASLVDYLLQIPPAVRQVQVGYGSPGGPDHFSVGKITRSGPELQLAMLLKVRTPGGEREGEFHILRALIDTGAEANLIRKGALSSHFFQISDDPIQLITANGQPLEGGSRTVDLQIFLKPYENGQFLTPSLQFSAVCYEADISVDIILSFPWMAEHKIGVFPHHRALVIEKPRLLLLFGQEGGSGSHDRRSRRKVNQISQFGGEPSNLFGKTPFFPLSLPQYGAQSFLNFLEADDYEVVEENIKKIAHIEVKASESEDPRIESFRDKIFSDFEDTVFRDRVFPNPPERGQFGYAYIRLKEGAVPQRQKPFLCMVSDKRPTKKL